MTTFYLSVAYLDAVFSLSVIREEQLKLIGYISIYMAAKMEEEDSKIPTVQQAVKMFRDEFDQEEIIKWEKFLFRVLGYSMNLKTPFSFLMFFFSKGFVCGLDLQGLENQEDVYNYIDNIEKLAIFFMDCCVKNYHFYQFTSIAIAATAISCARECVGVKSWSIDLEKLTFISSDSIKDIRSSLFRLFENNHPEMYQKFFPVSTNQNSQFENPRIISMNSQSQKNSQIEKSPDAFSIEAGVLTNSFANTTPSQRKTSDCFSTNDHVKSMSGLEEETREEKRSKSVLRNSQKISDFQLEDDEDFDPNVKSYQLSRVFGSDLININLKKDGRK